MSGFKFTEEQKEQVKEAVKRLESESSGEIVPYIAKRCDDYDEARWFGVVIFMVSGLVVEAILSYLWLLPNTITPLVSSLVGLGLGALGFLVPTLFPGTRLYFIGEDRVMERISERAQEVFLEEEVFNTRERTGILIFISQLEHKVMVLGDSGINAKVNQEDWDHVVTRIIKGIKNNNVANGLVEAIDLCKELLLEHGFVLKSDDKNELSDDLRIEED